MKTIFVIDYSKPGVEGSTTYELSDAQVQEREEAYYDDRYPEDKNLKKF